MEIEWYRLCNISQNENIQIALQSLKKKFVSTLLKKLANGNLLSDLIN